MTQARLTLTMPELLWVGEISRKYPEATLHVLSAVPSEDAGFALFRLISEDIDELLADARAHETIVEMETLQRTEGEATVQFETTAPLLMLSSRSAGMAIDFPVEIQNGKATLDVTGSHERLSALGTQFRNFGLDFEVEYIQERLHTSQLLTEKQQRLLLRAVEMGYYNTPRDCSLTELAEAAGIAKSTCSETLHRAEEAVIKNFIDDLSVPSQAIERKIKGE